MSRAQKLIPVPGTGKAAWMLSISLCKQMINTLHGIRKCGSDVGGASTAKRPRFSHGYVSETQSRSASHFCVYGTSKLRYQVRPQTANCHGRPSRSGPVGSGETRSVAGVSGSALGLTEQTAVGKQTASVRTKSDFSLNRKQRKRWMKPSWQTLQHPTVCVWVRVYTGQ